MDGKTYFEIHCHHNIRNTYVFVTTGIKVLEENNSLTIGIYTIFAQILKSLTDITQSSYLFPIGVISNLLIS